MMSLNSMESCIIIKRFFFLENSFKNFKSWPAIWQLLKGLHDYEYDSMVYWINTPLQEHGFYRLLLLS